MKKLLSLIMTSILSVATFAGCGLTREKTENVDELLKEIELDADEEFSGTLNIRTWSEDSEVLIMNSYIEAFRKKYPFIKINYKQDFLDNYYSALTNDFGVAEQTGDYSSAPDVFWISQDMVESFNNIGGIMFPLTEIDKADDSFDQNIFAEPSLKTCSVDGTMYALPRDFSQVVMFFNQNIFDAAGVAYPTAQMSRENFVKMLDDLRTGLDKSDAKNDYGIPYKDAVTYLIDVNACWDSWCWPLARSFGGQVVDADKNAKLDSDEMFEAIKFWRGLRSKNYVSSFATSNVGVNFRMQQSAIYFHTRSVMTSIYSSTKQIKGVQNLGVTALPQFGDIYSIGSGASGYSMYMKSPNKTAAWLFLKFIASEEGQNVFCGTGNGIPSVKSMLTDDNAAWRNYRSDAFGTAFDNNAFVYGMDMEISPYTDTREFLRYVPNAQRQNVFNCLTSAFSIVDTDNNSDEAIRDNLKNQNSFVEYYINRK